MSEEELRKLAGRGRKLRDILLDKGLAGLGDALVNFAFSLALSLEGGRPVGRRLDNRFLADALRASGLREEAPGRMDRHGLADAAEAILAYGWLTGLVSFWDIVEAFRARNPIEGLSSLIRKVASGLSSPNLA